MASGEADEFETDPMLGPWLARWGLTPDGGAFSTPYTRSLLLPVRHAGRAAILKVAGGPEEARGGTLMAWWSGEGAAPVLAHEPPALLLARAEDPEALPRMSFDGADDQAMETLCGTVEVLHRARDRAPPKGLVPLRRWFRGLRQAAPKGRTFARAWAVAEELLATPQDEVVLHGDITHANVLDFGPEGWLAIDPKGLLGERGYDYANIFRSPTLTLVTPEQTRRRLDLISDRAGLDRTRLLKWVIAHGALSAAWTAEEGLHPGRSLAFVKLALAELETPGR
jgi:streptomycin 6-kinase